MSENRARMSVYAFGTIFAIYIASGRKEKPWTESSINNKKYKDYEH